MNPSGDERARLRPEDERILDALVEDGFAAEALDRLAGDDRRRGERLLELVHLLHDYPVEDGDDALVHATLARIDRHEDEAAAQRSFDRRTLDAPVRPRGFRLPDVISVAAVLLIVASVMLPLISSVRHWSVDQACQNNLRQVGYGFGAYAADYDGAMPLARAGANFTWDTLANVVNLGPLVSGGYCDHGHLHCPGVHESDPMDASYSYQWQKPGASVAWGAGPGRILVLGDRNPLIEAHRRGVSAAPLSMSPNHGGRGQNVLSSDGSTIWLEVPMIGRGDNIWLPRGDEILRRGAQPEGPDDVFLVH